MSREEWLHLYDELRAVYDGHKDIIEMSLSERTLARSLGLLSRDTNGNTVKNRTGRTLFATKRRTP